MTQNPVSTNNLKDVVLTLLHTLAPANVSCADISRRISSASNLSGISEYTLSVRCKINMLLFCNADFELREAKSDSSGLQLICQPQKQFGPLIGLHYPTVHSQYTISTAKFLFLLYTAYFSCYSATSQLGATHENILSLAHEFACKKAF